MPKRQTLDSVPPGATFRRLVAALADGIGEQHIPLRIDASDIHQLLAPDAVHHELVQIAMREVYRANDCGHLDAGVDLTPTFAALGRVRAQLTRSETTDIDQINLLENLGWYTRQFFSHEPNGQQRPGKDTADGKVLSLSGARKRASAV